MTTPSPIVEWELARCKYSPVDPELFFPEDYVQRADPAVLALCALCPIQGGCLQYAQENALEGVWGGLTDYQRRQLDRTRHRMRCPGCGSDAIILSGTGEVCISCGVSWQV